MVGVPVVGVPVVGVPVVVPGQCPVIYTVFTFHPTKCFFFH